MAKKSVKSGSGLRRFLGPGESLRIRGTSGRAVKRVYPNRSYVLEVVKRRKVIGYINSTKAQKPVPKPFTASMVARLKHTTRQKIHERPRQVGKNNKARITNKRFLKRQIPKRFLKKIRRNKGKAFNFRVKFQKQNLLTHSIYVNSRISDENLTNLITSDLLYTLGKYHYKMSPKPQDITDKIYTKRIKEAELTLEFTTIKKERKRVRKAKIAKRSNEGVRRKKGTRTKR